MDSQADEAACYNPEKLPLPTDYGWSNYRLLLDMETDNVEAWVKYKKADESHYLLCGDDILLIAKAK